MDLTHADLHSMIFYEFKCNLTAQKSLARFRTTFGDEAQCKMTIYSCFSEFNRGRVNLSDKFCDGRPSRKVKLSIVWIYSFTEAGRAGSRARSGAERGRRGRRDAPRQPMNKPPAIL
ncbi:hypothetical protein EVAR_90803_1 [Eumeta japonica]|uniref:Mos1 transposase HTH domain-containing protein n=1 Tax=Eumeta variegata TaxID=151549 RepID=A0A4C2A7W3_EUMVA|nr:hypothetical protein EVAR_90803_1 [Eumeta japonica]